MTDEITTEFADAALGDARRSRRLPKLACALAQAPEESISAANGGWSEVAAAYRFLNKGDFSPQELILPHRSKLIERSANHACVIVIQDTTELDFTAMKTVSDLGPLNDLARRGFFMHGHYVVSEQGLPLGILGADQIIRDDEGFGSAAERKKLPIEEKESHRWIEGYRKACLLACELPDTEVFSVCDREGDIFELYLEWFSNKKSTAHAEWIVRANQDRVLVDVEDGTAKKLFDALMKAPLLGSIEYEVRAKTSSKKVKGSRVKTQRNARSVHQEIRAMEITPRPPGRKSVKLPKVSYWAVLAEEPNPPEGEEPIRWLLLTSKKITSFAEAERIIKIYLRRWDIEVFFRILKTGCRVERIQLKTCEALIRALMIYLVIAWRIHYLTHLGRQCPDLGCGCVFDEAEWKAACAVVKRPVEKGEPSLSEFIGIVGKLGGHLGRKGDGDPGAQVIWRGMSRVRDFACVWRAMHKE